MSVSEDSRRARQWGLAMHFQLALLLRRESLLYEQRLRPDAATVRRSRAVFPLWKVRVLWQAQPRLRQDRATRPATRSVAVAA